MSVPGLTASVHKVVHDALLAKAGLTALIGTRVYDRVPPAATPPYVVIGTIQIDDDQTQFSDASEISVTVHVWSAGSTTNKGSIEAKKIGGYVRQALATELQFEGHLTTVGHMNVELYRPSEDGLLTEGVLDFRYLADPT